VFDIHYVPQHWGIMRYMFGIPSYSVMVGLGIIAGVLYYFIDAGKRGVRGEKVIIIVSSALFFGMLGAKLPLLLMNYKFIGTRPDIWLEGKTIVGGFIGGAFGVIFIKRLFKIQLKMGNVIAPAVALGMSIGRIGCFFNGCCYGIPWPWGVNFGDGVLRLPTQLFESAFHFTAFLVLLHFKKKVTTPGILFKYYITSYLVFRFFSEFFRDNQRLWGVLTLYQLLTIIGLILINFHRLKKILKWGASSFAT
jgi:phosphatidylglycerol---prolipoprotein diacylglyceryl transferase